MPINNTVANIPPSYIRRASERCRALGGVNLGQGVCELPVDPSVVRAAHEAMLKGHNQYTQTGGVQALREAIAQKVADYNHVSLNPETEVIVTVGATAAFIAALHTLCKAGDNIIMFEPFYSYHQTICTQFQIDVKALPGADIGETLDMDLIDAQVDSKTRAIILCNPNNPSGKCYSKKELIAIGELALKHDLMIIIDEMYEHFIFPGHEHLSLASIERFKNNVVTVSGFSKVYSITGWRLGYLYGPAHLMHHFSRVHDLFCICPPAPFQHAMITALNLPQSYYDDLRAHLLHNRDALVNGLNNLGIPAKTPEGAYYLLADLTSLGFEDDLKATDFLLEKAKVSGVPGRAFYQTPNNQKQLIRFCFGVTKDKMSQALAQLQCLKSLQKA
jgi:aminotransferase